jgi:hypothetical protein
MYKNYVVILTHQKIGVSIGFYLCGTYNKESNRKRVHISEVKNIATYFTVLDEIPDKWCDIEELRKNQNLLKKNKWHVTHKEWVRKTDKELYSIIYPSKSIQLNFL